MVDDPVVVATILRAALAISGLSRACFDNIGGTNSKNQPIVAEGTASVKGKISSMNDTYFRLGDVESYILIINVVWTGAHAKSNPSPTTGRRYDAEPTRSINRLSISRDHIPDGTT